MTFDPKWFLFLTVVELTKPIRSLQLLLSRTWFEGKYKVFILKIALMWQTLSSCKKAYTKHCRPFNFRFKIHRDNPNSSTWCVVVNEKNDDMARQAKRTQKCTSITVMTHRTYLLCNWGMNKEVLHRRKKKIYINMYTGFRPRILIYTIGHQHQTVGTSARDFRRFAGDLRCWQAQMGTMAVDGGAVVHTVRLPVWMSSNRGDVGTVELVSLDYSLLVPVGPIQRVLERGYAERVR
ncbi:hypothetical protein AGLY_000658 [Aphis glycines]|uniref:Uncharacterized protein n=1 Tax=Aphis glycines TaxID=307491 RepID=A0A6G0U7K9_APHGL|nr:hypothetical protein AGLY_000658 [Aphis glycines]